MIGTPGTASLETRTNSSVVGDAIRPLTIEAPVRFPLCRLSKIRNDFEGSTDVIGTVTVLVAPFDGTDVVPVWVFGQVLAVRLLPGLLVEFVNAAAAIPTESVRRMAASGATSRRRRLPMVSRRKAGRRVLVCAGKGLKAG